jgi:uncharacterized membrane protein YfcA
VSQLDVLALVLVGLSLMFAGAVKGIAGIGMPAVAIPLLSSFITPHLALALLVIPVLITNLWQSLAGGAIRLMLRRFWPMITIFCIATWLGARVLVDIDDRALLVLIAVVAIVFTVSSTLRPHLRIPPRHERWTGSLTGLVAGVMNGVSLVNGPPLAVYLLALDLDRDDFVRAYGLIALAGALPLSAAYVYYGVLGLAETGWSLVALGPVLAGMLIGGWLRQFVNPRLFRNALLLLLTVLALNLLRRALL